MKNVVKIDISALTNDLVKVKSILAMTDNMATAEVANLYIELCVMIIDGMVIDPLTKSVAEQQLDSQDYPNRHNINPANRPSLIQEKYEKESE